MKVGKYFITGTGTGVGKTLVTALLAHQHVTRGKNVCALKPVVSGFVEEDEQSDPALLLRSMGHVVSMPAIEAISPWRFAAARSVHLAARDAGKHISLADVTAFCRHHENAELLLVEGAGGVMSPVTDMHTNVDMMQALGYKVILVAGTYLGALSHTLTALEVLRGSAIAVSAIVVSCSAEHADTEDTLAHFTGGAIPIYALPRLRGDTPEEKWANAPSLFDIEVV